MTLSYLTTQGNRVPFIHKGSRLSPESYALSHQPHICQRSQQMQNILKIFETFCKLTRAPGRAKNNCQLTKSNDFRSRMWTYWHFFSCTNLFANCEFWVTCHFYLSPKICGRTKYQIWGCVRGLWWEKIHFDLHFLTPPSLLVASSIQRAKRAASKIEANFLLKKVTSYHDSGDRNDGTFPFWDQHLLGYLQGPENSHPFWKCRFRRWYLSLNEIERTVESEANHHTLVEEISVPTSTRQKKRIYKLANYKKAPPPGKVDTDIDVISREAAAPRFVISYSDFFLFEIQLSEWKVTRIICCENGRWVP